MEPKEFHKYYNNQKFIQKRGQFSESESCKDSAYECQNEDIQGIIILPLGL